MWTKRITFFSLSYRWCSIDRRKNSNNNNNIETHFGWYLPKGDTKKKKKTHTNRISATDEWQWNESMWNVRKNDDTKKNQLMIRTIKWFRSIYVRNVCLTRLYVFFLWPLPYLCGILFIATINFWMNRSLCFIFCNCAANFFSLAFARGLSDCVWDVVMISGHYFRCFMSGPDKRFIYTCQSHAKAMPKLNSLQILIWCIYTSNSHGAHATLSD